MTRDDLKSNPYDAPRIADDEQSSASFNNVKHKCVQLLARRDDMLGGPWYYLKRTWIQQILVLGTHTVVVAGLWIVGFYLLAVVMAGFVVGRTLRDIRWWNALSKDWPITRELLDWNKIEEIAQN